MGKIMKVMRRKENADLAMKVIGGLIIAAGAAYLLFGHRSDALMTSIIHMH